jgi:hypothetical protein
MPNFFLIGAGASGTTSLYHYLDQHPQVFMSPVKEPCFFAPELLELSGVRPDAIITSWGDYQALFGGVRDEVAIGEASVAYLASERAPGLIAERFPDARILAILRDPADRLFSKYTSARAAGVARDFRAWARSEAAREEVALPPVGSVRAGRYASHLTRWFATVPAARRRILLYDDLRRDAAATMREVFAFLSVDPAWPVDLGAHHNVTQHVRWPALRRLPAPAQHALGAVTPAPLRRWFRSAQPPRPTPEERTWAVALYADEVSALERLIDRDLSAWRAGASSQAG